MLSMVYKNNNVYALYKGDTFIDVGTYDELASRQKMGRKHLHSTVAWTKKHIRKPGNHLLMIRVK